MPTCKVCGCGSGERIGCCHTCVRDTEILKRAWHRIRATSTVVPSDADAQVLDGLDELRTRMLVRRDT